MRKTILTVLVALLAVMAVTCDNFAPTADKEPTQYTEDGRPLIWLTINPVRSRALTAELAKGLVDFYEVAFKDPDFDDSPSSTNTKIYRTSWNYASTGRIAVPAGTYDDATKAVLFAGRYNDKTLFAVGIITATTVAGSSASGSTILPTTTAVTFTLSPLLNDINTVSTGAASSTFLITGPTDIGPDNHNYSSAVLTEIPSVELAGGKNYPIFYLPPAPYTNTSDPKEMVTATYQVNCGSSAATNAYFAGVMVAVKDAPIVSAGYSDSQTEDSSTAIKGKVTNATNDLDVNDPVPSDGTFKLILDLSASNNGLSRLSIDVPVCAIDTRYYYPGVWHIRGGSNPSILDAGITAQDAPIGGAVLLAVGPVKVNGIVINVRNEDDP